MKALVYRGPGFKSLEDCPKPALQMPGDAIVRVTKTTICGTDLHILKGDVPTCVPGRILGHEGVINRAILWLGLAPAPLRLLQTEFGLIFALTQIEMPLMLLPLLSVMSRIDPNLADASEALGASRWRTLFRVLLPLSVPGLVAGCLLVFASSTTAFISQSVIGGNRLVYLPLLVWQQSLVVYNWPLASVAALTLLVSVGACVAAISTLGRKVGSGHG